MPAATMKIAILDFDLSGGKSLCEVFGNIGYECDQLASSTELLQRLHHQPFDALVISLQLTGRRTGSRQGSAQTGVLSDADSVYYRFCERG